MSRLRRWVLSDRFFFLSCRVLPTRQNLRESEFALLAQVIRERRKQHGFLLTAWVFLPDHGHAIVYPSFPLTISRVAHTLMFMYATGPSPCDMGTHTYRAMYAPPAVKEYHEKVEYIHLNPVKAGLVQRPDDWPWSSVHDYTGTLRAPAGAGSPIPVDRITLPADPRTRI
jgi:putative transposase